VSDDRTMFRKVDTPASRPRTAETLSIYQIRYDCVHHVSTKRDIYPTSISAVYGGLALIMDFNFAAAWLRPHFHEVESPSLHVLLSTYLGR